MSWGQKFLGTFLGRLQSMILFTMSIKSENLGIVVARDTLYVKDGKIFRHIALTLPPKKDKKICERIK